MPDDTLPVHINREELHAVEVPAAFEATGSFDVVLQNHGESLRVHLHLEGDLSDVASIGAPNHYVEANSQRVVRVDVDADGPVRGKLKVASAYGAQTRFVDISVTEPDESEETVQVDESLSEPPGDPDPAGDPATDSLAAQPELLVLGLGVLALVVAVTGALVLENVVVQVGALTVLGGVIVALFMLQRS